MEIVIIEDEILTAEDLEDVITKVTPQAKIMAILHSVKEAIHYFQNNPMPQLIFSDIQLGDGLCFDIFSKINITSPIIFCTAFDEYAIKAFNYNSIHYVLKPFNPQIIKEAIDKYHTLKQTLANQSNMIQKLIEDLGLDKKGIQKSESLLVYYQNKVIPVKLSDIALFYIKNDLTYLYTFNQKTFIVNKTLDELLQLDNFRFYRANRQFIINRDIVKEVSHHQARKVSLGLNIPFSESITISKEKITDFFEWLSGGDRNGQ